MGRAVAGKPPKGWAERQRRLRRKKERRMRMLRGDGGAGAEDRAEGVPVAAEATPVFGAYGQDGASSSGAGQAHADCDGDDYYQQYEGYDGEYEGFYYDPSYEPSSDEEVGADAGSDLALDVAHQFLFGPEWRADILAFLSERAHVFAVRDGGEGTSGAQDDFSQSQHEAFCSFRVFAERRLDALLSSMGLTSAALAARCRRVLRTEGSERRDAAVMVVQSLLAVEISEPSQGCASISREEILYRLVGAPAARAARAATETGRRRRPQTLTCLTGPSRFPVLDRSVWNSPRAYQAVEQS